MRTFPFILLVVLVLNTGLLLLLREDAPANSRTFELPVSHLQDGDLVMRSGRGIISKFFRKMSLQDARYTHAGLVKTENGKAVIVHCLQDGSPGGLISESVASFTSKNNCESYAFYHYNLNSMQRKKLVSEIALDLQKGISFNDNFELNNGSSKYCTEWVYDRIIAAANDSNYLPVSRLNSFCYIAPDNLYLNPHARLIWQKKY